MTMTVEEFAARYDEWAGDYDRENDDEEYHAAADLVIERASPGPDETVVDLGTGTGTIALALADDAASVVGLDVSEGMLEQAREKAAERGVENVTFETGRLREPGVGRADVVVANFAFHHLDDAGKRAAIEAVAALESRKFVLGDTMFFGDTDPEDPLYNRDTVYPATVGFLANALTDEGFALTAVEKIHDHVGVLVAERV